MGFRLGVVQNCYNFDERTQRTLGGGGGEGGSRAAIGFLKMLYMVHCYSEKGSQNQLFQSTLLGGREGGREGGRGSHKIVLCVRS